MTGNNFRPDVVARIIELIRTGETDLRAAIGREFPELTALGIKRVLDIARGEIAERDRDESMDRLIEAIKNGRTDLIRSFLATATAEEILECASEEMIRELQEIIRTEKMH
jgi:hypothetical protein